MMLRSIVVVAGFVTFFLTTNVNAEVKWALKGDLAESCCCQAVCPCIVHSDPTLGHCEGSSLFQIKKGHYGDVKVDGINAVFSYRFGAWVRVYVDESATSEQADAVAKLLNQDSTFGTFFAGESKHLSTERTKVTVRKSAKIIEFSVPDAKVRLELTPGTDDKPITIKNLTIPWFLNGYTQYTATTTSHKRDGVEFKYTGTNGATSHIDAKGTGASN